MKNLIGIKCKDKYFVSAFRSGRYKPYTSLKGYLINGKTPIETFQTGWSAIEKEPKRLQQYAKQPDINYRYVLIDETMKSDKIPLEIKQEDAAYKDGYDWVWKDEYKTYRSLYQLVTDKQSDTLQDIEFEYETVIEVKEVKDFKGFAYDIAKSNWKHEGTIKLTEKNVHYQMIDKIVFPDILLPGRPCSLSQKQSFDIVRQYVKQHVNYEVASITSDYDFCFTVKKKIPLSETEQYRVDVNNSWFQKRKRKPKFETRYKRYREIECFNMAPKPYESYRIIQGFRGKDQEDLKNNIDNYCKKLIEFINEQVSDCPQCKGRGVILNES